MTDSTAHVSTLTCPACGATSEEVMPLDACVYFWTCPGCGTRHRPKPGDCCVFCSFGTVPCPPVQNQHPSKEPNREAS